jgi:propionyl-CoA carboxylase alpha chain
MIYDDEAKGGVSAAITVKKDIVITIGKDDYRFEDWPDLTSRLFDGTINGDAVKIQFRHKDGIVAMKAAASYADVLVLPARAHDAQMMMPEKNASSGIAQVVAPMPGLLTQLLVVPGDTVNAGDDVAVIEAMKMENLLKADAGGVVAEIHATEGDTLFVDQPILTFAKNDAEESSKG